MQKYILALDQGTTSSRAIIFDHSGSIKSFAQQEFKQMFPKPGWVEHDPEEIWLTQSSVAEEAIERAGIKSDAIAAIGITNQRETTVVWDRDTGQPIHNAIVWQDRRTAGICDQLKAQGLAATFREKTGLVIDAYFSATKLKWILDNVADARKKAEDGKLAFGTIDSWLIWKLTGGQKHITDVTNASRTMLFNIHDRQWDDELLRILDIPQNILPDICASSEICGETTVAPFDGSIPIAGIAGDQQAALFGQMCVEPGMIKNTYGTGCFMMLNTGEKPVTSKHNLLTTIAWQVEDQVHYALEGSVFIAGAVVQWLRDGLGIIKTSADIEPLAKTVKDNGGVYFVPAFAGLGAPYWDSFARGTIIGLTRGTTAGHIARAALEAIAFQTLDVVTALQGDAGLQIKELRVDGGASGNNTLMQFQADILNCNIIRPKMLETTALGAAYLAGLAVGFWKEIAEINLQWEIDETFRPGMQPEKINKLATNWLEAVERSRKWIKN